MTFGLTYDYSSQMAAFIAIYMSEALWWYWVTNFFLYFFLVLF